MYDNRLEQESTHTHTYSSTTSPSITAGSPVLIQQHLAD